MDRRIRAYQVFSIVFLGVVVVLAVCFFGFGLYRFPTTRMVFWLIVAFAVAVVAAGALLRKRTLDREKLARRFYLSNEGIYNYEIGYAPLWRIEGSDEAARFVMFAANSLVAMSYGFEVADPPADFKPTLVIETERFAFHRPEGDEGAAVIERWSGQLLSLGPTSAASGVSPDGEPATTNGAPAPALAPAPASVADGAVLGSFNNARELVILLEDKGPFALGDYA